MKKEKEVIVCTLCGLENARKTLLCKVCEKHNSTTESLLVQSAQEISFVYEIVSDSKPGYQHVASNYQKLAPLTVGMPIFATPIAMNQFR